jgi:hypothetical protein
MREGRLGPARTGWLHLGESENPPKRSDGLAPSCGSFADPPGMGTWLMPTYGS